MKKTLLALLMTTTITLNAQAQCSAYAETWNQRAKGYEPTQVYSHNEAWIVNQTSTQQHYDICYEVSTQTLQNKDKITYTFCESAELAPGQATGVIKKDPIVVVKYPGYSHPWEVAIDAVTEIHGECRNKSHAMKRLYIS